MTEVGVLLLLLQRNWRLVTAAGESLPGLPHLLGRLEVVKANLLLLREIPRWCRDPPVVAAAVAAVADVAGC